MEMELKFPKIMKNKKKELSWHIKSEFFSETQFVTKQFDFQKWIVTASREENE